MYTTKLLRVNSKYRTPNSASCTDFTVNIPLRDLEGVSRCCLVSARIPRMFGNVYGTDTVLRCLVSETGGGQPDVPFNVTVRAANYTIEELAAELHRQINTRFLFLCFIYLFLFTMFLLLLTSELLLYSAYCS